MLVIPGREATLRCIISKLDFTAFQRLPIGRSKNGDEDTAAGVRGEGLPIDIERSCARRFRSPFQDVKPARIVGIVNPHVVGHEIENEPDIRRTERGRQAPERILPAKLRVERIVVDHVIPVRTARTRLEKRGSIKMADAKGLEIRHQRGRSVEAEIRGELETVSRERDGGRHHPSPMLQNTDHGGSFVGGSPPQIGRSGRKLRGSSAPSSARLASILSILPWASTQFAVRIRCSHCAAPNFAPASCGTISRRRVVRRSRTSASRLRPSNVVRASQSSTAERKVASSSGSGTSSPNSAYGDLNSSRRPLRTASASAPGKSQKKGKGWVDPHSSPMNKSGGIGASSVMASAAVRAASWTRDARRSPRGRLPIWSWFCRKLTKASGDRAADASPRLRPCR